MDLEEVWRIREDEVYPALFGQQVRGIFPLDEEVFQRQFKQSEIDPRWLTYGVFEYAPTETRPSWLYATSGHSNPWDQEPEDFDVHGESGSGVEFVLETAEAGNWAIRRLQSMLAYDILLSVGRFAGRNCLAIGDRIPLGAPLNGDPQCVLKNLIVTDRKFGTDAFQLPSGSVTFVGFTAVSDAELSEAKQNGSAALIDRLKDANFHPVNDPHRRSIA